MLVERFHVAVEETAQARGTSGDHLGTKALRKHNQHHISRRISTVRLLPALASL